MNQVQLPTITFHKPPVSCSGEFVGMGRRLKSAGAEWEPVVYEVDWSVQVRFYFLHTGTGTPKFMLVVRSRASWLAMRASGADICKNRLTRA